MACAVSGVTSQRGPSSRVYALALKYRPEGTSRTRRRDATEANFSRPCRRRRRERPQCRLELLHPQRVRRIAKSDARDAADSVSRLSFLVRYRVVLGSRPRSSGVMEKDEPLFPQRPPPLGPRQPVIDAEFP